MLEIGDKVPDIKLISSKGVERSLSDYRGKKIILYFYPKDDTPGCTKEACAFRDFHAAFEDLDAVIIGVSKDALKSHEAFVKKYCLPFELLSDPDQKLADAFGTWGEKSLYGRLFKGLIRSTFLIDEKGILRKAWRNVRVNGHVATVLKEAGAM